MTELEILVSKIRGALDTEDAVRILEKYLNGKERE